MLRRALEARDAGRKIVIAPTIDRWDVLLPILPVLGDNPRHDGP